MIHLTGNFFLCYGSASKRNKIDCSVCGVEPNSLSQLAYDLRGWLVEQASAYDKRKARRYCPKAECRGEQMHDLIEKAVERLDMTDKVKV